MSSEASTMSRDSCSPSPERKIVVIIASSDDLHAISVAHFIDSTTDCTAIIVDFAEFPQKLQAFIRFDSGIGESGLIIKGEFIRLNRIRPIWLRRLTSHNPSQS